MGVQGELFPTGEPAATAVDVGGLGIDVVTVANNHSFDYGWQGLTDTIRALEDSGVRVVGAGRDLASAAAPAHFHVAGRRVGVLAFSCLLPAGSAAGGATAIRTGASGAGRSAPAPTTAGRTS